MITPSRIELDAPSVGELEKRYLLKAIDQGSVSTYGPFVPEFEGRFAQLVGTNGAVSTQSGTAALHVALHHLGIGPGDEVIVPALTFIASVNPVRYVGATPVFVDVDPVDWTISTDAIEKALTPRTKVILPVHLYGCPSRMDAVMAIAERNSLYVIEDATESLGARYKGGSTGSFGTFGCFSFNGNKVITTGGGGMVAGNDLTAIDHIRFLVNQANDGQNGYFHREIGFNYRMTNIEAALGLAQLERLDQFLGKKRKFNEVYREELKNIESVRFQMEPEGGRSSFWLSCVIFDGSVDVPVLQKNLGARGVPTRRVFTPVVEFPPYKSFKQAEYENAYRIYQNGLCLPGSTLNSIDQIHQACRVLKELL